MHIAKILTLTLSFIVLSGCVATPHTSIVESEILAKISHEGAPIPSESLNLNETKISMNVEGGFMREVSQDFSGSHRFQMRIIEEHATEKWSSVAGICFKEHLSETSACMQLRRISDMGPDYWATFYYLSNKQSPRQHSQILVDHNVTVGQAVSVTVKQKSGQLIFSINGKDEVFPVPFKASTLEYHCSSAVCEFRD